MSDINEIFEFGIKQDDFVNQFGQTEFHSNGRSFAASPRDKAFAQAIHDSGSRQASLQNLRCDRDFQSGGSMGLEGTVTWGGEEGPKWSVGAEGEYRDGQGNYVKGEAKVDSDGRGSAKVSAGREKED